MTPTTPTARLKTRYLEEIRPALIDRFGYTSVMQAPKIEKITLNTGVGDAKNDSNAVKSAQNQLAAIAGQRPSLRIARKSIAAFKLREGMTVGVSVTLRGERGYEFLDRLTSIAIPRIRDFRGLNPRSFDGRGNYSMGVKEQIIFPEIDYGMGGQVRGMDITITTTASSDAEAFALLTALGMPFARQGRPKDFRELFGSDQDTDPPAPKTTRKADKMKAAAGREAAEAAEEPAAEETAEPEAETAEASETEAEAPAAEPEAAEPEVADEAPADPADPKTAVKDTPPSAEETTDTAEKETD